MDFSKISKVLVSFAFLSVFSCGIISSQEQASVSENVNSTEISAPVDESSDSNAKVDESKEQDKSKDDKDKVVCKNLGSFTVNSTFSKQDSHFGLFKDENGVFSVKDITDENKDDANKFGECKSYKVTYNCYMCYYPNNKAEDSSSESVDESSMKDEKVEPAVESVSEKSQASER